MDKRLDKKVIVVSGGTKGVGKAACIAFAKEGARVVLGGRDEASASKIVDEIKSLGGEAHFISCDLNDINNCKTLLDKAIEKYGRIDGLFNYAGITPISALDSCDEKTFDQVMDINFKASFFTCQQAVKYMRQNSGGSIVLTGSAHAWGGQKDRAAYACSKGALLTLMEHIAHNYASEHIRCNYLTLGWTATEGELALRNSLGESKQKLEERASKTIPMGRMCEDVDYIEQLIYLMSDASSMMTGSILRITGGEYI